MNEINKLLNNLQNSSRDLLKTICKDIDKILDLEKQEFIGSRHDQIRLVEYVQGSIQQFGFYQNEKRFVEEIQNIITSETKNIRSAQEPTETITERLIQRFQNLTKYNNIDLNNDFRSLSRQVVGKFPTVSYEQLTAHFNKKQEQIAKKIEYYNNISIKSFVNMSPNLAQFIKNNALTNERIAKISNSCNSIIEKLQSFISTISDPEKKSELSVITRLTINFKRELEKGVYNSLIDKDMTAQEIETFIKERVPRLSRVLNTIEKDTSKEKVSNAMEVSNNVEEKGFSLNEMLLGTNNTSSSMIIPEGTTPNFISSSYFEPIQASYPAYETQKIETSEIPSREQMIQEFVQKISKELIQEIDKLDPTILNNFDISPKEEFLVQAAVDDLGYTNNEELTKIAGDIKKRISEHDKRKSI